MKKTPAAQEIDDRYHLLYKHFSNTTYKPSSHWCLPNSEFKLDPLYQKQKLEYIPEPTLVAEPFILSGPEFN